MSNRWILKNVKEDPPEMEEAPERERSSFGDGTGPSHGRRQEVVLRMAVVTGSNDPAPGFHTDTPFQSQMAQGYWGKGCGT